MVQCLKYQTGAPWQNESAYSLCLSRYKGHDCVITKFVDSVTAVNLSGGHCFSLAVIFVKMSIINLFFYFKHRRDIKMY